MSRADRFRFGLHSVRLRRLSNCDEAHNWRSDHAAQQLYLDWVERRYILALSGR